MVNELTSGLFIIPDLPAGVRPSMLVSLSNLSQENSKVLIRVNGLQPDGTKQLIREEQVNVSPLGSTIINLIDQEIEGMVVEINISSDNTEILPSASVIETASFDGSTQLVNWISPSEFVTLPE